MDQNRLITKLPTSALTRKIGQLKALVNEYVYNPTGYRKQLATLTKPDLLQLAQVWQIKGGEYVNEAINEIRITLLTAKNK